MARERFPELVGLGEEALAASPALDIPELEAFDEETARFGSPAGHDWRKLARVATTVARKRCDLKAYSYLALATFYTKGPHRFGALADVLAAYRDVVVQGWNRCSPEEAYREDQFSFLSEQLASALAAAPPGRDEVEEFADSATAIGALAEAAGAALGLGHPVLGELRQSVEAQKRLLGLDAGGAAQPAQEAGARAAPPASEAPRTGDGQPALPVEAGETPKGPAAPASPAATLPVTTIAAPAAAAPPAAASPSGASAVPAATDAGAPEKKTREQIEQEAREFVARLAAVLREADPTDPAPYWILRSSLWASHRLLQPEQRRLLRERKFQTALPRPEPHLATRIEDTIARGRHADAIALCEDLLRTYPLWLDLQRWVVLALDALGAADAHRTVLAQLSLVLLHCPELPEFKFAGGMPFASTETQAWIKRELARQGSASPVPVSQAVTASLAPAGEEPGEALPEGFRPRLVALEARLARAVGERARFRIRLDLAAHCIEGKRADLAYPILEQMGEDVEAYQLGVWEPPLAVAALRLQLVAARLTRREPALRAGLWNRLCQLSPSDAEALEPEGT
jgi:type VI secretion system protein VasJ